VLLVSTGHRYRFRPAFTSLILTTNLPFESWTEVLGSERLTGATIDRLTYRCQIIETKGSPTACATPRLGSVREPARDLA
jgi:hypothetical protein